MGNLWRTRLVPDLAWARVAMWLLTMVLVIGAFATWRAYVAVNERSGDLLVVHTRLANIDRVVDASIDAADGSQDVVFGISPGEDEVVEELDDIFIHTGRRSAHEAQLLTDLQTMVDSVEPGGRVDELTVVGFENTYIRVRDDLADPTSDELRSARDRVRWIGALSALAGGAALLLGFAATRQRLRQDHPRQPSQRSRSSSSPSPGPVSSG